MDGIRRTLQLQTGSTGSPEGELRRTLLPHASGVAANWTEFVRGALGRTGSLIQPKNPVTSAAWGATTYLYEGPLVKVTDPAGDRDARSANQGRLLPFAVRPKTNAER